MRLAITGATGFLGHYIVAQASEAGHRCRCWYRPGGDRGGLNGAQIEWLPGELGNAAAADELVAGCDAVVHAALYHPGGGFRGGEGELLDFVDKNVLGTLRLIEAARGAGVGRFIFISSCAVHDRILPDRPLDETHPTCSSSHYGAHKAALEQFVHSYGFGQGYDICALRPTGIYGLARPAEASKWFELVRAVAAGQPVECRRGGKEVHAADVARAVELLLTAPGIAGESYNCYDRYVSEFEVATLAAQLSGSGSPIAGEATQPKNQIVTDKLRALGMRFSGRPLLEATIGEMLAAVAGGQR
ncbi:MAG TPA: NAD(P)-dependent oxidoreductase [Pirellulales bacterium]|nr:NAD(P)-dependent oxidoreductase [Pirellulales bacterium]